jgi:tRNA(Arg) A34 adenosine deaminase TadA
MAEILVLANETIGGKKLLDAIRERHAEGDAHFHVVVPQTRPRHGNVIYDEAVRDSAQVRVDLALAFMHDEGIDGAGQVGDGDPLNAALDAVAEHGITEIIVSTLPAQSSGWMKRDLIEALEAETGLPVKHVVVDLAREGLPFGVTLVVANQTVAGGNLVRRLEELAEEGPRRFIIVVPQDHGEGHAVRAARERLGKLLASLEADGIVAAGMIGDPDPYDATMNAVQFFHISEIVISTLPRGQSKWLADKLPERVRNATNKPVEHVESAADPVEAGT